MPETPEERAQRIQEFHTGLMTYQKEGRLQGLPDDFETFSKAFNHPDYRKDLHDFLLMKQSEGKINDVPHNYREFSNFFDPMPEVGRTSMEDLIWRPDIGQHFEVTDPRSEKSVAKREYLGLKHPSHELDTTDDGHLTESTLQARLTSIAQGDITALENLNDVQTAQLAEAAGMEVARFEQEIEKFQSPLNYVDDRTYMRTTSHVAEYEQYQELRRAAGILERNMRNPDDWSYLEKLITNMDDRFKGASLGVGANAMAMREMFMDDTAARDSVERTRKRLEQQIQSHYATTDALHFTDIGSSDGYILDFVRWQMGTMAELIPIVGSIMAGGIIVGAGAKVAGATGLVLTGASMIGSFASGYTMYAGDMFAGLTNEGVERDVAKRTALIYAAPAAAVSIIVPGAAAAMILGGLGRTYVRSRLREALIMAGISAPAEGIAESIAESFVIMGEQEALGKKYSWDEKIKRIINAGAAGTLMGLGSGFIGGAGRPRKTVDNYIDEFLDHAGAVMGQNPELMSIRERVEFQYDPDASAAEQASQLTSEYQRLEKAREEANQRLQDTSGEGTESSDTNRQSIAQEGWNEFANRNRAEGEAPVTIDGLLNSDHHGGELVELAKAVSGRSFNYSLLNAALDINGNLKPEGALNAIVKVSQLVESETFLSELEAHVNQREQSNQAEYERMQAENFPQGSIDRFAERSRQEADSNRALLEEAKRVDSELKSEITPTQNEVQQELGALITDYDIALEAIDDQLNRLNSGIIQDNVNNLVNRPILRQHLLESLYNLEAENIGLTPEQEQMKKFLLDQEGATSNKKMQAMNATTDAILVDVQKRTNAENLNRLDRLMNLSKENQTTFEEQVEIAAIMFNKPAVYQAWLNSSEVTTENAVDSGEITDGPDGPPSEGPTPPPPTGQRPGARPDITFMDEDGTIQSLSDIIDQSDNPAEILERFPFLTQMHEQLQEAESTEQAEAILLDNNIQRTDITFEVLEYLDQLMAGETTENLIEFLTSFDSQATEVTVSIPEDAQVTYTSPENEVETSVFDLGWNEINALSSAVENAIENVISQNETPTSSMVLEALTDLGISFPASNEAFLNWIESRINDPMNIGTTPDFHAFIEWQREAHTGLVQLEGIEGDAVSTDESNTRRNYEHHSEIDTVPDQLKPIFDVAKRLNPDSDVSLFQNESPIQGRTNYRLTVKKGGEQSLVVSFNETPEAVTLKTLFSTGSGAAAAKSVIDYAMAQGKEFHSDTLVNSRLVRAVKILERRGYEVEYNTEVRTYDTDNNVVANMFGLKYPEGTIHNFTSSTSNAPVFKIFSAPETITAEQTARTIAEKILSGENLSAQEVTFSEQNTQLVQNEVAKIEYGLSEEANFIVDSNEAITQNLTNQGTIGQVEGTLVNYGQYQGVLTRDSEGNFVVETAEGTTVEVANSMKDPDILLSNVGVSRALSTFRNLRHSEGSSFVLETTDPATGEVASEPMTFIESNFNEAGEVTSVTMETTDGQQRTIRDPRLVEQVVWDMYFNQEGTEQTIIDALGDETTAVEPVAVDDATSTMSLDDNDARINTVFERFENNQALTLQEQENALEWINERLDDITRRNPDNITELLEQLTQFENEVLQNDPSRRPQPGNELQPVTTPEDAVSPDATEGTIETSNEGDGAEHTESTPTEKLATQPEYTLTQSEYLETVSDQLSELRENNPAAAERAERRLVDQHKQYIADALQDGHAVPEHVLRAYPDLLANTLPDYKSTAPVESVPVRPAREMAREVVAQHLNESVQAGTLTAEQAEALLNLLDVRAHLWARQNRRPEGDYYKLRFDRETGRPVNEIVNDVVESYRGVYNSVQEVFDGERAKLHRPAEGKEQVPIEGTNRLLQYQSLRAQQFRDVTSADDIGIGEYGREIRSYRPTNLNQLHSGKTQLVSHADVAYLFTELENAANENIYIVLIDENNNPTVIHHSIGNQSSAIYDPSALAAHIKDFNPKRVYMVHNHPSGTVMPSQADVTIMKKIERQMPKGTDAYGIIINRDSGIFSVIKGTTRYQTRDGHWMGRDQPFKGNVPSVAIRQQEIRNQTALPVDVLSYDRMVHLKNRHRLGQITSPRDLAQLVGLSRFTIGNKDTAIFVNTQKEVVGVVHLNNDLVAPGIEGILNRETFREIELLAARFNDADVILISNRDRYELPNDPLRWFANIAQELGYKNRIFEVVSVDPIDPSAAPIQAGDALIRDIELYSHEGQFSNYVNGAFVNTMQEDGGQYIAVEEEAINYIFSEPKDLEAYVADLSKIFLKDMRGNDLEIVEQWAGAQNGNWTTDSYDKLSKGFTVYLAEGNAPSTALERVFAQFKEWLSSVYNYLTETEGVQLSEEVRGVFDKLFEATIEQLRNPVLPEAQKGWEINISWNPEGTETHKGNFAVVELADLQASHHPDGHVNSRHIISRGQPRDRSTARAKQRQDQTARELNPAHITGNHSTAFFFSPVVNQRGEVIQGNGRSISLGIAASQYPARFNEYQNYILNHAYDFGFDRSYLEGFNRPVIVRMLDVSDAEAIRLGNIQQQAEMEMSKAEQALSAMRQLSTEQKQYIGRLISDSQAETFRAMLDDIGVEIIDTVLGERGDFIDNNGSITIDGKNFVEDIFRAMTFDSEINTDAIRHFNRMPHSIRAGIEKSYGTILEFIDTPADLRPSLQKAVEIINLVNNSNDWVTVDDMFNSGSMFENYNELFTATERTLATAIFDTQNPNSPLMKRLGTKGTQTAIQRLMRNYKENIYGREDLFDPIPGLGIERAPEAFQNAFDQRDESFQYPSRPESPESSVEDPGADFEATDGPVNPIPKTVTEETVKSKKNRKEQLLFSGVLPKIIETIRGKGPKNKTLTSRQDVTNHIIQKLNVSVGVGRSRSLMNAFGFYRWKPMGNAIRNRVANDLSTLAHETGHYLHDVLFDMRTPTQFNDELINLGLRTSRDSYSEQQKIMEGQAEFFRILVHDPAKAKQAAPGYYEAFNERLNNEPVIKRGVVDLIQLIEGYTSQSLADQFRSQIARDNVDPTATGPQNESAAQYMERHLFNAITPLREVRKTLLTKDNEIDAEAFSSDSYYLSQLAAGVPGQMKTWLRDGVRNTRGDIVSKSFESIYSDNGITTNKQRENFEDFLLAKRVLELYEQADAGQRKLVDTPNQHGGPLGLTSEQARAIIDEVGSAEFEKAAQEVYDWTDATLEWAVDRSYMTRKELIGMKRLNRNYVPMHRVMDYIQNTRDGKKSTMIDQPSLWQKIRGSGRPILPPVQTLIRNTQRMLYMVERNYAAIQLFQDINNSELGGVFADKVSRPVRPVKGDLAEIQKALKEAGLSEEIIDAMALGTAFELWRPIEHNPMKREVTFRRNGKSYIWQIHNDALYDALVSYAPATSGYFSRFLQISKRIFRTGVVISLDFIAGVTQSDQMAAHINSTYGYAFLHLNPAKKDFMTSDFLKGMASILTHSEEYQLWLHSKAGISGIVDVQSDQIGRVLTSLGEGKAERIVKNIIFPARWIQGLETFSAVFENSTRVGEFKRGIDVEGRSEEGLTRAAIASRNLTDYALMGNSRFVKMIARNKAFFNAGLQGPYASIQAIKRDPVKFMTRGILSMTLMSLALDRLLEDNEDFQEREQERQLYWLIPKGDPKTTKDFMRIRKPWQFGAFFGTIIPNALKQAAGYEDTNLLEYLIPTPQDALTIAASMVPNGMLPLIEVMADYNAFYQNSIDPYFDKDIEPYLRYDHNTNELEKGLGRLLNASPRKLRHLIRGYSGMMGVNLSDLSSEFLLSQMQSELDPEAPSKDLISKIPGARVFISSDLTAGRSKSVQQFYNLLDDARMKDRSKDLELPRFRTNYYISNADLIRAYPMLQSQASVINEYRSEASKIYLHPTMAPDQKRQALYDINQRIIMIAQQTLNYMDYQAGPAVRVPSVPQQF